MVKKPGKHQRRKQTKIYVGRFFTLHIFCFMLIDYTGITKFAMLLLVSCMSTHRYLLYFARFCAGSTPYIANKNTQQRALPGFVTNSFY